VKHQVSLTITSLLALLLFTVHYAQDIVLGIEPGDTSTYIGVLIAVAWLYPVVVLAGRKSGYLINLVFALLAVLMPVLHMRGAGLLGHSRSTLAFFPAFFWVWTIFALCVAGALAFLLSVHGLVSLRRAKLRSSTLGG
jgi:hypothetical protein